MRYLKKISILALIACLMLSACLISCDDKVQPSEEMDERYVIKTEIIDGNLWITYSDAPTAPTNAGRVWNSYEGSEGLDFHPLADGTYGVSIGTADQLTEIIIPATYNGKAVTKILDGGFSRNYMIKKVVVPATVTEIGNSAFSACTSLEEISLPHVKTIGEFAFNACTSLRKVELSDDLEFIRSYGFANTMLLTEIVIPKSVKYMGSDILGSNTDTVVKCGATEKPEVWDKDWASNIKTVIWGYEG